MTPYFTKINLSKHKIPISIILFILAFGLRLIYLGELPANPLFDVFPTSMDHFNFDESAQNFARGDLLARATNNQFAPLYKYFLGILYWLFGRNLHMVYLVQFFMGSLACVLVYRIGERLFGTRSGVFSGLGLALYTTHIIYEGIILRAAFISFFGVLSCYLLLRLKERPGKTRLIWATLSLSIFFQTRPNTLLCLPLICVFLHREIFSKLSADQNSTHWKTFFTTLLISFAPLLAQCYLVHEKFVFFDASGPHTFISGNIIDYSGVGFEHGIVESFIRHYDLGYGTNILFLSGHILDNPWQFFLLYVRKLYFFLNDFEAPSNISIYLYREFSKLSPYLLNHYSLVSSLALIGMALSWKRKKNIFLLNAYAISLSIAIIIFFNTSRYRIPVVPFFMLFAGYGLNEILNSILKKNNLKTLMGAFGFTLMYLTLQEPSSMIRIRSNDYGNLGNAYITTGQWGKAEKSFRKSVAAAPANPNARINLGRALTRRNLLNQAATQFNVAIQIDPNQWQSHLNLGIMHSHSGNWQQAEKHLLTAWELYPDSADIGYHLGDLYGRIGQHALAIKFLKQSLAIAPGRGETLYLLGIEHEMLGNREGAIHSLENAVRRMPNHARAWNNLGFLYSRSGRRSEARSAFQKALQFEPDFEEARKNLEWINTLR